MWNNGFYTSKIKTENAPLDKTAWYAPQPPAEKLNNNPSKQKCHFPEDTVSQLFFLAPSKKFHITLYMQSLEFWQFYKTNTVCNALWYFLVPVICLILIRPLNWFHDCWWVKIHSLKNLVLRDDDDMIHSQSYFEICQYMCDRKYFTFSFSKKKLFLAVECFLHSGANVICLNIDKDCLCKNLCVPGEFLSFWI